MHFIFSIDGLESSNLVLTSEKFNSMLDCQFCKSCFMSTSAVEGLSRKKRTSIITVGNFMSILVS